MVIIIIQLILYCALFTAMVKYSVRFGAIDGLLRSEDFCLSVFVHDGSWIIHTALQIRFLKEEVCIT